MPIDKVKQGRTNRRKGAEFELRVRKDLESKGWYVSKYQNNIDLIDDKMIAAKSSRFRLQSTGFPDFICWRISRDDYQVIGVECKTNGYLDRTEKAKCKWFVDQGIFHKILVAKKIKVKNRIQIEYRQVE